MEIFDGDREIGALNFHHSTEGDANVTIEADMKPACDGTNSNATFRLYERIMQNSSSFSLEQRLYKDISTSTLLRITGAIKQREIGGC